MGQIADFFSTTSQRDYLLCCGNAAEALKEFPAGAVNCCITSPPYWNQRKYTGESILGNEQHVDEYVQHLREIFQQLKRVLTDAASLWLNIGDGVTENNRPPARSGVAWIWQSTHPCPSQFRGARLMIDYPAVP